MIAVGKTDIGLVRSQNQDSIFVSENRIAKFPHALVVADGIAGHTAGYGPSRTAVESFCKYVQEQGNEEILDSLIGAVQFANSEVYAMSKTDDKYCNMGTTFVAASVSKGHIYIAHVGDSRLYRIRNNTITQITNDHSLVNDMLKNGEITQEEAETFPYKNVITRAVGTDAVVNVDGIIENNYNGDILLLCSDGLSGMVGNDEILQIVSDINLSLTDKVDKLIDLAKAHGGLDNISVVLAALGGADI